MPARSLLTLTAALHRRPCLPQCRRPDLPLLALSSAVSRRPQRFRDPPPTATSRHLASGNLTNLKSPSPVAIFLQQIVAQFYTPPLQHTTSLQLPFSSSLLRLLLMFAVASGQPGPPRQQQVKPPPPSATARLIDMSDQPQALLPMALPAYTRTVPLYTDGRPWYQGDGFGRR